MRSPGLVVMVVAALAIVGYAFYTLTDSSSSRPRPATVRSDDEPSRDEDDRARRRPHRPRSATPPRGGTRSAPITRDGPEPAEPAARAPEGPPRPEPEISLPEARTQFAEYMAELTRLEADGIELTSPQWVDYYKRGHEALLPLQQHLDWKVTEQAEELRRAGEDMRTKLSKLEPGRTEVSPPEPDAKGSPS